MALTLLLERRRTNTHICCLGLGRGWGAHLQDCTRTRIGSNDSTVVILVLERPTPVRAAETSTTL